MGFFNERSRSSKVGLNPSAVYIIAAVVVLTLLASPNISRQGGTADAADPCATIKVSIGPDVPHDYPGGKRPAPSEETSATLAAFAWQQFLALSWQSSYRQNQKRGTPDTDWSYEQPYQKGVPLVWETYAHRSELRPAGESLTAPFDSPPKYLFENPPKPGPGNPSFTLFNNLDEDNEIGSCDVYLGPGDPAIQPLVLYQAKTNRAEYDYIKQRFGEHQQSKTYKDSSGKEVPSPLYAAQEANKASIKREGKPSRDGINLPAGEINGNEGAIEIKTAFLMVTDENREALEGFFKTEAIFYTKDGDTYHYHNGVFALLGMHIIHKTKSFPDFIFTSFEHKNLRTLKLKDIGFQYILLSPFPNNFEGVNFTYLTEEQKAEINVKLMEEYKTKTVPSGVQVGERQTIVRQTGSSPTIDGHLYPIPKCLDEVTNTVHIELQKLNPKSPWLNYKLIGVQALITRKWAEKPSEGAGPNHFMANFVIESDKFLGNFFGPGFGGDPFGNGHNILFQGKTYNTGGCKGCHGVAQTASGTDFSFLLDYGAGKPVDNPDTIFYVPPPLPK